MNKKLLRSVSVVALGILLASCGGNTSSQNNEKLNFRLAFGSYVTNDANTIEVGTAAVVLKDDKVVSAYFDVLQAPFQVTEGVIAIQTTGKNQTAQAGDKIIETKKELGTRYGMANSATEGEWYVQAAAFENYCVGKTLSEITSANYRNHYNANGTVEVPGCSISQANFVNALKNVTQTKDFKAEANKVAAGVGLIVDGLDDKNVFSVTLAGSATDSTGKVFETSINAYQIPLVVDTEDDTKVAFDTTQKQAKAENLTSHAASDATKVLSKRELRELYGMEGTSDSEWYVHADSFATYAKSSAKASDLVGKNYKTHYNENGTVEVPGCTITMTSFAAAVAESATLRSTINAK